MKYNIFWVGLVSSIMCAKLPIPKMVCVTKYANAATRTDIQYFFNARAYIIHLYTRVCSKNYYTNKQNIC